jgi:DNA-binding NarL/FixJ family response regulator
MAESTVSSDSLEVARNERSLSLARIESSQMAIRPHVLIADDHTLVVEAFKKLLEPNFEVVGTVSNGRDLLEVAPKLKPDVVLLDLGMPLLNGQDAGERLKALLPKAKVIVLTMNEDSEIAAAAIEKWASGFLLKNSAGTELTHAIKEVLKGKSYVTPRIAQKLFDRFVRDPRTEHTKHLTSRQREVLQLLAEGRTMKEAADVLHVTPRTIAFHKYKIMDEFGLKTNSDLLRFAMKERLITPA